ncbi:ArsR/SmtB family transcription factor [Rhizobium oryzicola]|uniref:Helix-turn-helix transcriptional regulator n=1 Tax=Rhizobium oryzicola TaxID=1232668 RepID=A0ABT8SSV9_9HYPH|nr:helix-turn-helix transcriptional regulator [Rhizobium oryzicola]MDO1581487.1 helix-turn-helix transcriptional regulator [Rhizobium oryzicola]
MSNIASGNAIAEIAHLIGDPARANMLLALMGGQALTAGELAFHGHVTAQTTSGHLSKMAEAGLIAMEKQGRHRYYRLASPDIAAAVHALMSVAAVGPKRHRPVGPRDEALRLARTCYDHMAGRLALAVADALVDHAYLLMADGAALVTEEGRRFFCDLGVDVDWSSSANRPLCRCCLDWSERRSHLAGRLGAALLQRLLDLNWLTRVPESRALAFSRLGEPALVKAFNLPDNWRERRSAVYPVLTE